MNMQPSGGNERIESVSNPLVKELRELRTPKGRKEQRRFLAEGERTLAEAAAAGWRASILLIGPKDAIAHAEYEPQSHQCGVKESDPHLAARVRSVR